MNLPLTRGLTENAERKPRSVTAMLKKLNNNVYLHSLKKI